MHILTPSSSAVIPLDYQAPLNFAACATSTSKNELFVPLITKAKKTVEHSGRFAFALAHEVRNPLTNINLSVEMLNAAIDDDQLKLYLDIIMRSSIRINNLVNDLLKYQETDEVLTGSHSPHQLLDEALALIEDRILLKGIRVRKVYTAREDKVCVNKEKVRIALINIFINAIDAMPVRRGELTLVTRSIGSKYIIEIEDNGTGIGKDDLKNIFTPYFTNKPGGLGLGLSTTLAILQTNNIGVKVRSEEGEGTCFILSLDTATA